jgi:hypothetical protein
MRAATIAIITCIVLAFGGEILWMAFFAAEVSHAQIESIREVQTARGPMLLASETVGRSGSNSRITARRTTLIDPRTFEKVARATDRGAEKFWGQAAGGGALWLSPVGSRSVGGFSARDPLTLAVLLSSDDLAAKHPAELGGGIHELGFDERHDALYLLANDNHGYLVDGSFALTRAQPPAPVDESSPPAAKISAALELIQPDSIELVDAKAGRPVASPLLRSRASLRDGADVLITRTRSDGSAMWQRPLPGQSSVMKAFQLDDRFLVVSRARGKNDDDWITALDAERGTIVGRYHF